MANSQRTAFITHRLFGWLNSDLEPNLKGVNLDSAQEEGAADEINITRLAPFLFLHLGCLGVFWVGFSWTALTVGVSLYFIRMFAITAFYHRYFSHRSFETNRFFQFFFAVLGLTAIQRGPLWWASNHRHHHRYSDQSNDIHSPITNSFFWSHIGWILCDRNMPTRYDRVKDFQKFPELVFLNKYDWIIPLLYGLSLLGIGEVFKIYLPELQTNGLQLLVWGFFISTVVLFHGTCTINSLSHVFGSQRFKTNDESKNNFWLSLITLGEGWHNNHHRYPASTRQGFYWWEVDITYYILVCLQFIGIVKNITPVPESIYLDANQEKQH